jgi:hypothetical protein
MSDTSTCAGHLPVALTEVGQFKKRSGSMNWLVTGTPVSVNFRGLVGSVGSGVMAVLEMVW